MNTFNFKLYDTLLKELNLPEDKARNILESIEYKSLIKNDVLRVEMKLK